MEAAVKGKPRLKAVLGTVMQVTFSRADGPVKAQYVGMERDSFIIVKIPFGASVHEHLFEGNKVVVKYISGGRVYGFQSKVLMYAFRKPMILTVLTYPETIETHLLRGEERVQFLAPALLKSLDKQLHGFVLDISTGGCRFAYEPMENFDKIDFGSIKNLRLAFQMLGVDGVREIGCHVMNVSRDGDAISIGLKFDNVDSSVIESINEYVKKAAGLLGRI